MCGIAGFVGAGDRDDLERMTRALAHRGPNGEGFHIDAARGVHLGHRRLAIVDVAGGHQPMWNEDGSVGVVFNGEIYNHSELRAELTARGHVFASHHSDTEVLVHGYEEWGRDLPLRLNGMFAFCVYDARKGRLFLARDRFGEKPLYYGRGRWGFAFASELTALAEHPRVSGALSQTGLKKLFGWGYIPAPHTILQDAHKLPGGHWLEADIATGAISQQPYWQFEITPDDGLTQADEPALVEECAALFAQAARRRLMSDVPLGVFLSGGLDSSLVLASLAADPAVGQLSAYTIGFEEPSYDESAFAAAVATHVGARHRLRTLSIDDARDLIPDVLSRLDEPLGDPSVLPTHLVSRFAREDVTVALSGDGGDELFAGYDPFLALTPAAIYARAVPAPLHTAARQMVNWLPRSTANMSLDFKLRRTLMGLSHEASARLPVWMAPVDPKDMAELFGEPVDPADVYAEAIALWEAAPNKPTVDRALEFFTRFYLQDNILTKVDRAAMLCSLETRAVFLDNDLVAFCQRLPHRFKMRGRARKYLLKRVAERLLPRHILERKKKGFGIPLAQWLKDVPATPPLSEAGGLSTTYARHAFSAHRSGAADHRLFLWNWLALQAFASKGPKRGGAVAGAAPHDALVRTLAA